MGRLSRLEPLAVGALLIVLVFGPTAAYAESQTVTFRGGPLAPVLCPAAPDRPSVGIVEGTWVNVVNQTGASAVLDVDGAPGQTIAQGAGLSVMLPAGHHELRLIPDCPTRGKLLPVLIDVLVIAPPASSAPAASGPPPPGDDARAPGPPDLVVSGDSPGSPVSPTGAAPSPGRPPGPSLGSAPGSAPGSGLGSGPGSGLVGGELLVVPYVVTEGEDPRGARLLAVIAVICVFGVTTAIIRAILAQRTTPTQSL